MHKSKFQEIQIALENLLGNLLGDLLSYELEFNLPSDTSGRLSKTTYHLGFDKEKSTRLTTPAAIEHKTSLHSIAPS